MNHRVIVAIGDLALGGIAIGKAVQTFIKKVEAGEESALDSLIKKAIFEILGDQKAAALIQMYLINVQAQHMFVFGDASGASFTFDQCMQQARADVEELFSSRSLFRLYNKSGSIKEALNQVWSTVIAEAKTGGEPNSELICKAVVQTVDLLQAA